MKKLTLFIAMLLMLSACVPAQLPTFVPDAVIQENIAQAMAAETTASTLMASEVAQPEAIQPQVDQPQQQPATEANQPQADQPQQQPIAEANQPQADQPQQQPIAEANQPQADQPQTRQIQQANRITFLTGWANPERFVYGDIAVAGIDGSNYQQITTYGYNFDPQFSPTQQYIVYRSLPASLVNSNIFTSGQWLPVYNIWLITPDGQQSWKITDSEIWRGKPAWSADGSRFAFPEGEGVNASIIEVDVATRSSRVLVNSAENPQYLPDGSGMSYISHDGSLMRLDSSGATQTLLAAAALGSGRKISAHAWLPDAQHIIYAVQDQSAAAELWDYPLSIWVADADGAATVKLLDTLPDNNTALYGRTIELSTSPDGNVVAVRSRNYGDACHSGVSTFFLLLAADYRSASRVDVKQMSGYPTEALNDVDFFATSAINWVGAHTAFASFEPACIMDDKTAAPVGLFMLDPVAMTLMHLLR